MIDTSLLGNLEINRTIQKSVTGRMSKIDNLFELKEKLKNLKWV